MTTPQQQVIDKCKQVYEIAQRLYGVNLNVVRIHFNLKGRVAGWAQQRGGIYTCRFNYDMISRGDPAALRDMLEEVVPHELAHIVCYMRRELGRNHDAGWQRVCRALGGTGDRTHDTEVVYGKGTTYEYTTDRGHKVRMSDRHHKKVQAGLPLRYRKGLGTVTQACAYSIVGVQGRTLQQPVVRAAPVQHISIVPATPNVPVRPMLITVPAVVPGAVLANVVAAQARPSESKAATSRRIMLSGFQARHSYEQIIQAMMLANGYDRQLARATFKANAARVGIPATFYA